MGYKKRFPSTLREITLQSAFNCLLGACCSGTFNLQRGISVLRMRTYLCVSSSSLTRMKLFGSRNLVCTIHHYVPSTF